MEDRIYIIKRIAHLFICFFLPTDYADKFYARSVIYRAFSAWFQQYELHQSIKHHQQHMEGLSQRFQIRRYFQIWIHCILLYSGRGLFISFIAMNVR